MRRLEKIELIDRIGRELQSRMSYADIDVYMAACDVDTSKETSNVNSKWVYVKELLADEPDGKVLEIADELEIEHDYSANPAIGPADATFWKPGMLRLFLSHTHHHKETTARLQQVLLTYGVTSFVAHEDIQPAEEWLQEIEKGLASMDALAAVLTPEFSGSSWTDHEVGIAVGRGVLVIPIRKGQDPYGFIGKYQGFQAAGKTVGDVAKGIFEILAKNGKTKSKLADAIVGKILASKAADEYRHWLELLIEFDTVPTKHLEQIRANAAALAPVKRSESLYDWTDRFLKDRGLDGLEPEEPSVDDFDDDIPF
jgi:hypothetical protein